MEVGKYAKYANHAKYIKICKEYTICKVKNMHLWENIQPEKEVRRILFLIPLN